MDHRVSLPPISDILRTPPTLPQPSTLLRPQLPDASYPPSYPVSPFQVSYARPGGYVYQAPYMPLRAHSQLQIPTMPNVHPGHRHSYSGPHIHKQNTDSGHNSALTSSPTSTPSVLPRLLHWKVPLPAYELQSGGASVTKSSTPRRAGNADLSLILGIKRKTRNNLPKETTHILLKWLNEHLHHPYPNSFEKNHLMAATGLNQQQLSNWFINARRRKIKGLKEQRHIEEV